MARWADDPLDLDGVHSAERVVERLNEYRRNDVPRAMIFVGTGTCGLGAGAGATVAEARAWVERTGADVDIVEVGCIGLCAAEPMLDVQLPGYQRVSFVRVTGDKVAALLDRALQGDFAVQSMLGQFRRDGLAAWPDVPFIDEHPFFVHQRHWVLANCGIVDPESLDEYIARGGYRAFANVLRTRTREEVCELIDQSGLRGRGGGGFPTGRKWKYALAAQADQKYLICNADEGDPGAFMDRAVIEGDPHRLVEGMAVAAYAIGASKAYVYIRAEYPLAIRRLKRALAQAGEIGLLGYNILDSGFNLDIAIKKGAGAFVCGEETALIHSIEGKRGMPRPRPPFPAQRGLFDRPTIINNVETLANVPGILARGSDAFAALGTQSSKGTKVFALSGNVDRTGLVEVPMGTTLRQIVFEVGGGIPDGRAYKAVQIGGPSGGCIPEQHLDVEIDYESLKAVGAIIGSGGLVVMDDHTCMVDVARFFMEFIQSESCGKCIPCREGTRRMLEILERIIRPRREETRLETLERFQGVMEMQRLAEVIRDTSLCGLGQTAPNPVLSTLRWFREEYEAHVFERKCPAGVYRGLVEYRIDPKICRGCTLCAKKCPAQAIMGAPKSPHYILADKCVGCGNCVDVCPFGAVTTE